MFAHRLLLACTALLLLPLNLARAEDIKSPIRGLVSMGAYRFVGYGGDPVNTLEPLNAKPGIFGGLVVIASWKQLQPTPQSEIGDNNVIDQALAEVRAYNERNPHKLLGVKLRVWGGFEAPDWAKQLGGMPIETIFNTKQRIVGHFWSPAYRQAWARLQQQLAARFDARPLIKEVAVTSCMSYTAEPFVVPTEDTVIKRLREAGFSDTAYKECLTHAVSDYAPWKESRLVLSVNPLRTRGRARQRRRGLYRRRHTPLPADDRTPLRARQPRSRYRPADATLSDLRDDAAARSGDRISDLAKDAQGLRGHDQAGRCVRCERDRALPGLRRISAGGGRQAQGLGGAAGKEHRRGEALTRFATSANCSVGWAKAHANTVHRFT
jgi:hypothetical protein